MALTGEERKLIKFVVKWNVFKYFQKPLNTQCCACHFDL